MTEDQIRRKVWRSRWSDVDGLAPEYYDRYCRAPQPKPIVLVRQSRYYIAINPLDLWGSKEPISKADLMALIDRLTCQPWPFPAATPAPGGKTAVRRLSAAAERANRREIANGGTL